MLPVCGVSVAEGARAVVADAIRRDPETWNDAILGCADVSDARLSFGLA